MISIITPVINESAYIKPFFKHLNTLRGDFELILVDGGSTDDTKYEIKKNRSSFQRNLKLVTTYQGRGNQMNRGAEKALGDILLFLHIDCILKKDVIPAIEKEMKGQRIIGGGMTQAFLNPDNFLKLLSKIGNVRVKITNVFFGDFGIFIRKDIFDKMGGYDDILFLEDVEFCKKAKKYGKLKQIDHIILTSPRRFSSHGNIKITVIFIMALLLNSVGLRPKFLTKYIVNK